MKLIDAKKKEQEADKINDAILDLWCGRISGSKVVFPELGVQLVKKGNTITFEPI